MQFKVCGITDITQAHALEALGVQYIGFIFYPASKRYALGKLSLSDVANFKPVGAKKVGVFVNMELNELLQVVQSAGLDMVQLHGDETPEYCAAVRAQVQTVKVFRVGAAVPDFAPFENVVDYFLFDTDSALYGGTGQHFNWELIKGSPIPKPYFLSGGIGPNDIQGVQVMEKTKAGKTLLALDINSQFELEPGIKNLEKIKTFIHAFI
ncbi:MAG: phosphoribosylanthranilate isomerase [Sediminibacterium sp.]|nr:phosphoribosylanthranilate isomerase [Sediminibacterium sp.]MBP6144594.1 phosphoribosylanthranilate isomerase [Sediminibacterium sp.]